MPHELYMKQERGALKLQANIVGRVLFVDRKLGEKVQSSVRERTEAAEKQRTESKIKMLDVPPPQVTSKTVTSKKRKVQTDSRRTSAIGTPRDLSVPSTAQQSRVASPRPQLSAARAAQAAQPGLRQRMIHYVALRDRTEGEVYRCVGGNNLTASQKEGLSVLLEEVSIHDYSSGQFLLLSLCLT